MSDKTKTIKIKEDAHKIIKEYCERNGLKFARFIEKVCVEFVEKNDGK